MRLMTVLLTASMGRIGLPAEFSSGPARGSMALMASTATSITAGIHVMVTTDRYPSVGHSPSSTSRRTKPTTDKATSAIPAMMGAMSTALDFQAVVTPVVVTDRELHGLSGRPAS